MAKTQEKIKIQLVKSTIGSSEKQVKIVRALGLKKTHQIVEHLPSATIMGMVNKIPHLVQVVK